MDTKSGILIIVELYRLKKMKQSVKITILYLFALSFFVACSNDDNPSEQTIIIDSNQQTDQHVYADKQKGTSDVRFTTSGAWTSSISETQVKSTNGSSMSDWISISPDRGTSAGDYTISINLKPNYTGAKRSATISINCNGGVININISQDAKTETGEIPTDPEDVKSESDVYVLTRDGYWKNGEKVALKNGTAASIFVLGNDVYIAGKGNKGGVKVAKYWKNDQEVQLGKGISESEANSIFVIGSDIYVSGYEYETKGDTITEKVFKYWKNGQAISLDNKRGWSNPSDGSTSMYISDNNIYILANEGYWKNGNQMELSDARSSGLESIFVLNNDVYIAGSDYINSTDVASYWKNGIQTLLSNNTSGSSSANVVFVSDNDVYILGEEEYTDNSYKIKYWKNNQEVVLYNGASYGEARALFVLDNDVYVAASLEDDNENFIIRYWKNGQEVILGQGDTVGMYVVKKTN